MRTTIVRVALGLALLSFVACKSEKPKPPNTDAFDPNAKMKEPPPPPKLPDPSKAKE